MRIRLVGLLVALLALGGCSRAALQGHGQIYWHYDPVTGEVSWQYKNFPKHEWAHFDIYYESGHPAFWSTMTLNSTGYAKPDSVDKVGCGWQWWVVYQGHGPQLSNSDPIEDPPKSDIMAEGKVFACGGDKV